MNTKICTSLEQSKKLLSLGLDPSTADMCYPHFIRHGADTYNEIPEIAEDIDYPYEMPCWSLVALLELMPDGVQTYKTYNYVRIDITFVHNGIVTGSNRVEDKTYIDAVFEMVCWLIEQKHIKVKK